MLTFIDSVYKVVLSNKAVLPKKLKPNIEKMVSDNFMANYATLEGLEHYLSYMDRRTKFPSNFTRAIQDYQDNTDRFDQLFNDFFPDLIDLAESMYKL